MVYFPGYSHALCFLAVLAQRIRSELGCSDLGPGVTVSALLLATAALLVDLPVLVTVAVRHEFIAGWVGTEP